MYLKSVLLFALFLLTPSLIQAEDEAAIIILSLIHI